MHAVKVARAQLSEAQRALETSEAYLKSITEMWGTSKAARRLAKEDLASCTTVVEALKQKLATKIMRI